MYSLLLLLLLPTALVLASPFSPDSRGQDDIFFNDSVSPPASVSLDNLSSICFPALGFEMPSELPSSTEGWWCDPSTEFAFVGFSYEVTACQSLSQLQKDFADIRNTFHSRYVRIYGACDSPDRPGFYDDIITAAWDNALGFHALVWFGFTGSDEWIGRRDNLFGILHSNKKAKFVTRVVQFGSEPLFDSVLSPDDLTAQVWAAKKNLSDLAIPVTVSELAYGYQEKGGAQNVLDAIDSINIHMLPYFAKSASTGDEAWPLVLQDLNWFIAHGKGKKMHMDENGWPWETSPSVQPNSPNAVANIPNERAYYDLLDQHCVYFKNAPGGGIGWFAHIYSDAQEPGYGIYDATGKLNFPFAPRTSC